ncbi:MAG TPA: metallopeptidase TldD-related protein [Vicinamibacterales bacterium]|nr:metallopeptidase TldD-related protein [Vicinamibacterales bacterium]
MYSRDEVKAITDKIFNMAKGVDSVEVDLTGSERSGTRWANSSITVNLVQYDRSLTLSVRSGQKTASATTRDFSDAGLQAAVDEAVTAVKDRPDSQNLPELLGEQKYIDVDAALPSGVNFGPRERALMVKESLDINEKQGTVGSGYIPKNDQTNCTANTKGLFAYYRSAEAGFVLTCRMPDGSGSGWAGITGVKDMSLIKPGEITEIASQKALRSRKPKALEPGRYTVILEPRANARLLSLMTGIFNQGGGQGGPGGGGGGGGFGGGAGSFMADKKPGDKIFSDLFSLKSDIGHPILRQTPILGDNRPAAPVTWVENGVLRNFAQGQPANVNMSLVMGGSDMSIDEMVKKTRRGLLVTFFWYIRGVPAEGQPLLNTGMTRDGLFLIENGEITTPVQNFRWNMSPLVAYNNMTLVGKPVPMHMGESYDGGGTGMIPPVRIEDFYMTSVSPAV